MNRFMGHRTARLLLWIVAAVTALTATSSYANVQPLDRIVAVVNNGVVLQSDLHREMAIVKQQLQRQGTPMPPEDALRHQVLERLIVKRLELQFADRSGITVDEATLNAAVQRVAENNHMSLSQFRNALAHNGINYDDFRKNLREQIIISRLQRRVINQQVNITPQEIDDFLASETNADQNEEYLVGHILIALPEGATPDQIKKVRQKAEAIRKNLVGGANFASVAAANSDAETALKGGSLGWRKRGELPTLFAKIVPTMKVGEISKLIQSPSGFNIIKLLNKRSGKPHIVTQTHVRHILIRTNAVVSDRDARERLETLRQRILNGASFGALARANSADRASAVKGGDLGWVDPGSLDPTFEQVMNSLKPDQISKPFKTPFGWHIVQVLGRRQHDNTAAVRRETAAKEIRQRKGEEVLEQWIRRLRDEAYVDYRLTG